MKTLEGLNVKLSEVNKILTKEGKLYIMHCQCMRRDLWNTEFHENKTHECPGLLVQCPVCGKFCWLPKEHLNIKGEFIPRKGNKVNYE